MVQSIQYDAFNQMHDDSIGKELHELVEWSLLDSCRLRRMIPHALGREHVGFRGKGAIPKVHSGVTRSPYVWSGYQEILYGTANRL